MLPDVGAGAHRAYSEIAAAARGRRVVLFGAGAIAEKVRAHLPMLVDAVVDNNVALQGTEWHGLQVLAPSSMKEWMGNVHVVVCSTALKDIIDQLGRMGLHESGQISIPPHVSNFLPIISLRAFETDVLVASGDVAPSDESINAGGGLYLTDFPALSRTRRVLNGACHGVASMRDSLIVTSDNYGLVELNPLLEVIRSVPLPPGCRPHGVTWDQESGVVLVASTGRDSILLLDSNLDQIDEIPLSSKFSTTKSPQHHVNDIVAVDGMVFATMFSISGNWKRGCFDGGVVEIDISRRMRGDTVISDLWMPHSVSVYDDELHVLDSFRGELLRANRARLSHFPGFMRGLDQAGDYLLIGQSQNRNAGRAIGHSDNISIDAGLVLFDPDTHLSTTSRLPDGLTEIHAVKVFDQ